ncbi:hypothetical protein N7U66_08520 [Lacinutrix neustonica]|uniref:Uncharacterized protein n=1 Tax=Lacinutrix neustonica TaxID=2980107 RepID=A0A9E8MYS8_9FLAO|nr:hypothetical protein [Lacinutrix neustonica]WAC03511.1 hypothetical protein N7U66_08520 [Lacinutrix neustonica]
MALVPIASELATFEILSDCDSIPFEAQVYAVVIKQVANAVDEAIITLVDGDANTGAFPIADAATFEVGSGIEIRLGYNSINKSVFKGRVQQQKISIIGDMGSFLLVTCAGDLVRELDIDTTTAPVLQLTYGEDVYDAEIATNKEETTSVKGTLKVMGSSIPAVNDRVGLHEFGKRFSKTSLGYRGVTGCNQRFLVDYSNGGLRASVPF